MDNMYDIFNNMISSMSKDEIATDLQHNREVLLSSYKELTAQELDNLLIEDPNMDFDVLLTMRIEGVIWLFIKNKKADRFRVALA